jgi:hypothetical protein
MNKVTVTIWDIVDKPVKQIGAEIEQIINEILLSGGEVKFVNLSPFGHQIIFILVYESRENV